MGRIRQAISFPSPELAFRLAVQVVFARSNNPNRETVDHHRRNPTHGHRRREIDEPETVAIVRDQPSSSAETCSSFPVYPIVVSLL